MKKILTYSLIGAFVLLNLADMITTLMCYYIKPDFNEINPVYLLFGNIWVSLLISKGLVLCIVLVYFWLLKNKSEIVKYVLVLVIILGCLLLYVAVNNNIKLIQEPWLSSETTESIKVYAAEMNMSEESVKLEIYKQEYSNPFFKSVLVIFGIFIIFLRIRKEND